MEYIYTCICSYLYYFWGGYDGLLLALFIFMIVNYITNIMCALVKRKHIGKSGLQSFCKNILILLLVGIANILDIEVFRTDSILRTSVILFYLATEGLSLLNNTMKLGVPVPNKLRIILEQILDKENQLTS